MLHHVKDLSPEQRRAVENLLGRPVAEDESVSIRTFPVRVEDGAVFIAPLQ